MGNKQGNQKVEEPFNEKEKDFLDQIFHQMAIRSPDDTIAKDTFLNFFDLPGVVGERLFEVFDRKKTGVIDFEEFMEGYYKFARGSTENKMEMMFQLFDLDGKGGITKQELKTVLLSIVTPPQHVVRKQLESLNETSNNLNNKNDSLSFINSPISKPKKSKTNHLNTIKDKKQDDNKNDDDDDELRKQNSGFMSPRIIDEDGDKAIDEVQQNVEKMVEEAFKQCDKDRSGRLDGKEFRQWLKNNEQVVEGLENMFVQLSWDLPKTSIIKSPDNMYISEMNSLRYGTNDLSNSMAKLTTNFSLKLLTSNTPECKSCNLRFVSSRKHIPPPDDDSEDGWDYVVMSFAFDELKKNSSLKFCPCCGKELIKPQEKSRSTISINTGKNDSNVLGIVHDGVVRIPGGRWGRTKERFVVLQGKFLYYYKSKDHEFPEKVIFIQGYFIELDQETSKNTNTPKYCVKGLPPPGATSKSVILFVKDKKEAQAWVSKLELAAQTVDIKKHYELKEQLGKGSFAQVYYAVEKGTSREVAVKVIQKKLIDGKQKEYIRIEMSVMKLVKHPHVVLLEKVFETRNHIYMVMPLYKGGDLYDYMKNNARHGLPEDKAKKIIWNVLHALKYLHGLGIVHRDLKPENLLLVKPKDPTEIVITDFGLSKFAAPHEAMKAACGTLSYVAPEVLKMEGYGKEVDLWSVGIILFLVLRAKLPFHDQTKNKIIARILRQPVQMNDNQWKKISKDAKDLISNLLKKDPKKRITVTKAMEHKWFESLKKLNDNKDNKLDKPSGNTLEQMKKFRSDLDMLRQESVLKN